MFHRHRTEAEITTEELTEVFSMFDLDGSGKISADSLQEALSLFGYDVTIEDTVDMISKVDTDEDGLVDLKGSFKA